MKQTSDIAFTTATWSKAAQSTYALIDTAVSDIAASADIGPIERSLKWGQPAWRPKRPRTGSTLRCHWSPDMPSRFSLFVHCQTTLSVTFADLYPHDFTHIGNRELAFDLTSPPPLEPLRHCILLTLTYHR